MINFLFTIDGPTIVFQDNNSAIKLAAGAKVSNKRSKHFGLEFDLFREYVRLNEMKIMYRSRKDLPADVLAKPLPAQTFCVSRCYHGR